MANFKVCTWNVENLFRPGGPSGPRNQQEYQEKIKSLSQVITGINADVIGLQEVGQPEALQDLMEACGIYNYSILSNHPDAREIRVAFLSKFPVDSYVHYHDFPQNGLPKLSVTYHNNRVNDSTHFGRGVLAVKVNVPGFGPLRILNAHLKSKLLTFTNERGGVSFVPKDERQRAQEAGKALLRRTGEAVGLRVIANDWLENNNHEALIVLGDLNDGPEAATTQILLGPGGSQIMERDKEENKITAFDRADKGDDARLFSLHNLIPAERRYSRVYMQVGELIDHIFASAELFPMEADGKNRRLPVVDSIVDSLQSISDDANARRGKPGSDHAPVVAVFNLG